MQLKDLINEGEAIAQGQRRLAEALGVPPSNLNAWKHGKQACPKKHQLRLAAYVGRDPVTTVLAIEAERLKAHLGEASRLLAKMALGAVVMLSFGASDRALAAAGPCSATPDDV